jgi:hypothetical protein
MAANPLKQEVLKRARTLGTVAIVKADRLGDSNEITIEAPTGKVWACRGVHEIVICGETGVTWDTLYSEALSDMASGLFDCDDDTCEWCHE